ncbi:hypothetical protein [Paenisporosarcina sp. TG20]|uniref:hypothetical protein n=1 Tax=Paenisporosarcina sp. TG20 TaxID=1211706 RepID=UPI00035D4358|nr:hypothetical protein [Paenisporosarcina sp. TG20]
MRKYLSIISIAIVAIGGIMIFFIMNGFGQNNTAYSSTNKFTNEIETIEKAYMTDEGLIRNYPVTSNREFLLESQGFYLELLLLQQDEKRFRNQVEVLKKFFIVEKEDNLFIKWKSGVDISVNAFIDDMRIIHILRQAAVIFEQEYYLTLANELTASIKEKQIVNNLIPHYYDWETEHLGTTMFNSYLHNNYMEILDINEHPSPTKDGLFFAEEQIIANGKPISAKEAHMIDQLLIATYCIGKTCENHQFDEWIQKQWQDKKIIYGRYDKVSGIPTTKYESIAVYALAVMYFNKKHPSISDDITQSKSALFNSKPVATTHFFDYILGVIVRNEE